MKSCAGACVNWHRSGGGSATGGSAFTKQLGQLHADADEIRRRVLWHESKLAELLDRICVVMGLAADLCLVGGVSEIIICTGKTPMQTFLDAMPIAKEKMIAA
jgi:hypothetical protein